MAAVSGKMIIIVALQFASAVGRRAGGRRELASGNCNCGPATLECQLRARAPAGSGGGCLRFVVAGGRCATQLRVPALRH